MSSLVWSSVVVAAVSILLASVCWDVHTYTRTLECKNSHTESSSPKRVVDIYSPVYNLRGVSAPLVSTSWKLRVVSRIILSSPLGSVIARRIFDRNNVQSLIELADAIQNDDEQGSGNNDNGREFALGTEPFIRLNEEQYEWHVSAAASEGERIQQRQQAQTNSSSNNNNNSDEDNRRRRYNSILDYHKAYKNGQLTPTQMLEKLLAFVEASDPKLRCVEQLDSATARAAAAESTRRWKEGRELGIWDGIPVLIKSEIAIQGLRFTSGRQPRLDGSDIAEHDDLMISRFRGAGAIVLGSSVMHEKGVQPTGYNSWYGGPQNPHDLARFSGGSSSGSAVAVASGMVPVAVGFDGGGSIRIPASWSGTVGLAVGYGRIPFNNKKQNIMSVAKAGVLTSFVNDATEALLLLGQPLTKEEGSEMHPYSFNYGGLGPPPPHSQPRWSDRPKEKPIRIGVFPDWVSHRAAPWAAGTTGTDDAVYTQFSSVLKSLTRTAAATSSSSSRNNKFEVVEFSIPQMHHQALAHGLLITAMFTFGTVRELFRGPDSSYSTSTTDDDLQPATGIQLKLGTQITAMELLACFRIRNFAVAQWRRVLSGTADVILTPTTPMSALKRPRGSDAAGFSGTAIFWEMMRFVWPGNLAGLPGLAVPVGGDSDGMPVSVQIICTHWHEADCLSVGRTIEELYKIKRPVPALETGGVFVDLLRD